jgi:hypothetical protein
MPESAANQLLRYRRRREMGRCVRCGQNRAADKHAQCRVCLDRIGELRDGRLGLTAPRQVGRSRTIAGNRTRKARLRLLSVLDEPGAVHRKAPLQRPRTRADCKGTEVCPWVSCKWHLMLDVNPRNGSIKINYPGVPLDELPATCALELIDRAPGGMFQSEIGVALNLTRERTRQIVQSAMSKVQAQAEAMGVAEVAEWGQAESYQDEELANAEELVNAEDWAEPGDWAEEP